MRETITKKDRKALLAFIDNVEEGGRFTEAAMRTVNLTRTFAVTATTRRREYALSHPGSPRRETVGKGAELMRRLRETGFIEEARAFITRAKVVDDNQEESHADP